MTMPVAAWTALRATGLESKRLSLITVRPTECRIREGSGRRGSARDESASAESAAQRPRND